MVHILTTCSALERRALFSKLYTISILGGITRVVAISRNFSTSTHTVKTDMELVVTTQKWALLKHNFWVEIFGALFSWKLSRATAINSVTTVISCQKDNEKCIPFI